MGTPTGISYVVARKSRAETFRFWKAESFPGRDKASRSFRAPGWEIGYLGFDEACARRQMRALNACAPALPPRRRSPRRDPFKRPETIERIRWTVRHDPSDWAWA